MGRLQEAKIAFFNILGAPFGQKVFPKDKITAMSGGNHVDPDEKVMWLFNSTKDFLGSPIVPSRSVTLVGPNRQERHYEEVVRPEHKGEQVIIYHR